MAEKKQQASSVRAECTLSLSKGKAKHGHISFPKLDMKEKMSMVGADLMSRFKVLFFVAFLVMSFLGVTTVGSSATPWNPDLTGPVNDKEDTLTSDESVTPSKRRS